jgi:hypothetical protein
MKKDIVPIADGLLKLGQLEGVMFTWKEGTQKGKHDIGVIAQDVQKVVPEAVSTSPDGMLGVDYGRLVPLLISRPFNSEVQRADFWR